ncbi:glycosyltransferase [Reyranella sp.]|uniref:glycosyltransferase family 4 protein n=1 Tax=Reyranella sp. TaxID=1929291 RepID=UPI00273078D1|nr:glycosyltransferase [Reyranella sp.]MDP2376926.1 glycosyltransferase [Reyranella sp.]
MLKAELSALEIGHACLASAFADDQVTRDLKGMPCFTRAVYGRNYEGPGEFARSVRETTRELSRGLRQHRLAPDLLILPCCDQVLALAVARHLRRHWLARPPRVVLWLLFGPHYRKPTDDPSLAPLYAECREAFASLRRAVGAGRIMAYCETSGMAEVYREVTGLDVRVASGPGLLSENESLRGQRRPGAPTVACVGFANESKGYHLLPGAIERLLAEDGDVRFNIHGVYRGSDAEDQASDFERIAGLGPRVVVRTDVLSPADYLSWLRHADLLLLPYDPDVYRTRGSGVFAEARHMGIPVVATKGCGFAQAAFEQGWGVAILERDETGVARAVLQALEKLDDMTARAQSQATVATAEDDAGAILRSAVAAIRAAPAPRWPFLQRLFTGR